MNDRYKQLATEATAWCEQHAKGTPVAWEWEQKFAELVVRDCTTRISTLMAFVVHESPDTERRAVLLHALNESKQVINEWFGLN